MSDERDDDLLRNIWKEQDMQVQTPDAEALRRHEQKLEAVASRRNRIEYIAGGIAILVLGAAGLFTLAHAATLGSVVSGIGHLAVAAAMVWVLLRLARMQRAARVGAPGTPILTHLRDRLAAERDMLRRAWAWYVAPLVPGFAMIYGGAALEPEPNWLIFWAGSVFTGAVVIWVAWLNRRAADRLQGEIDRLDNDAPDT